jgi:membrane protein YqaA with SNARE-associated domain
MEIIEHITTPQERGWAWFTSHARSRFALWWLALVAVTDTIFSPLTAEAFLAVLVLAHRERWKTFLLVSWVSSMAGAAIGYWLLYIIFRAFGEPFLASWGIAGAYTQAQELLGAQIFVAMLLASFTPLPDKLFIYAAGILGSPFIPFMLGFAIGRGARMSIVTYVVWKFGAPVLDLVNKYSTYAALGAVAILVAYAMVHWHLLPWF